MSNYFLLLSIVLPISAFAQTPSYPETKTGQVKDTYFEYVIADEYRWLEDIRSEEVQDWIADQNRCTQKYLLSPSFTIGSFREINKYSAIQAERAYKSGDYYFRYFYRDSREQPALYYKHTLRGNYKVIVDPNEELTTDRISIREFEVSANSNYLAYQFSRNGSDWGEIKVVSMKFGRQLKDHIVDVKFSNISWKGNGFFYLRYQSQDLEQSVGANLYYHKIGSDQDEDMLIFKRSDSSEAHFQFFTTDDESYFIMKETDHDLRHSNYYYIDFNEPRHVIQNLLRGLDSERSLRIIGNFRKKLIAVTTKDANNGKVVEIDPEDPYVWKTLIPESDSALLLETKLLDNQIINVYQSNFKQYIYLYNYDDGGYYTLRFPFGKSINGFSWESGDREVIFNYQGYTYPGTLLTMDLQSRKTTALRSTRVTYDNKKFKMLKMKFESKDGTEVPLFLMHKEGIDLTGKNPLLLNAYGGFGIVATPNFDPGIVYFLESGGIFAFAGIRGGGDNGKNWWLSGAGLNKQNSFDDFIAAAEYLIENNYTSADHLAITGASNGGLVVAAAMIQRPELFKVCVPLVAPLDMLRFEQFTAGHFWRSEYSSTKDRRGFENLLSYSPLHNIKDSVNYPATMIMTSEFDDRVVPLHSYKFAAKLQNRSAQKNPILLRVEKQAGHYGANTGHKAKIQERADMYDFILNNLSDD